MGPIEVPPYQSTCVAPPNSYIVSPSDASKKSSADGAVSNKKGDTSSQVGANISGGGSEDKTQKPYTDAENELLTKCWISISTDSVIGNDKKLEQMWQRIAEEYNKNRPANTPERSWKVLKSKYFNIQKQTKQFCAIYNDILDNWPSGCSDSDIYEKAQVAFKSEHLKTGFKLRVCWEHLKRCPKFEKCDKDILPTKKVKTNEFGDHISSDPEISAQSRTRPIGQKAAKRKMKEKNDPEMIEQVSKRLNDIEETTVELASKQTDALERLAKKGEWKVLMKNTNGMTPEQLQAHNFYCEEIKKKWGIV